MSRHENGPTDDSTLSAFVSSTGSTTGNLRGLSGAVERGQRVPGQWAGSPSPNQHEILTGSDADGRVMAGLTCADWTSSSSALAAQAGHSDGLGPGGVSSGNFGSWNPSHTNQDCADTAPRGGAGRIYCFAIN